MNLWMLLVGALIGCIVGPVFILVGVLVYDRTTKEEGSGMVCSSEVARVREELENKGKFGR